MIIRLSAVAALFAVFATASLAIAEDFRRDVPVTQAAAAQNQVVRLERVVVTARRLPAEPR